MPGSLVEKRSARLSSSANAGSGSIPARASNGAASARMRPLGTAMTIGGAMARGFTCAGAKEQCVADGGGYGG